MTFTEDGIGLVIKLGRVRTKEGDKVMKFDCEPFSCYPEEKEILFFGGDTKMRIKGIMQYAGGWKTYDKFMDPIDAFYRMIHGKSLRDRGIWNKPAIQRKMNLIIKNVLCAQQDLADQGTFPRYILSLVLFQRSRTSRVRLNYNEMTDGCEWLRCIFERNGQLDIANICAFFEQAESITFLVYNERELDEDEWESVVQGLAEIRLMGLSTKIVFELSSEEERLNAMYDIASGYLLEHNSEWKCERLENDKNHIFNFKSEDVTVTEKESKLLSDRMRRMIESLERSAAKGKEDAK